MIRKVKDLLKMIAGDAESEVQTACKRWNTRARDVVREVTALKFTDTRWPGDSVSVPISVVPGLPVSLDELGDREIPDSEWIRELIGTFKHRINDLDNARKPFNDLFVTLKDYERWYGDAQEFGDTIERVESMCARLRVEAQSATLMDDLTNVEGDILGGYFYHERPNSYSTGVTKTKIDLYWLVIGAYARLVGVPIEDLTVLVMSHELAHAYSHVGMDIDGKGWQSSFGSATTDVTEGIAQYYTWLVLRLLDQRHYRNFYDTYEKMMGKCKGPYIVHIPWTENYNSEVFRRALIDIRRQSQSATLEVFEKALYESNQKLNSRGDS